MTDDSFAGHRMACAVCAAILDERIDPRTGEHEYIHSASVAHVGGDDHIPVPVTLDSVRVSEACDFCFVQEPERWIDADSFEWPDLPDHWSIGGWAACTACAELIDAGAWKRLVARAANSFDRRHNSGEMDLDERVMLWHTYQELGKHMIGKSLRIR